MFKLEKNFNGFRLKSAYFSILLIFWVFLSKNTLILALSWNLANKIKKIRRF